MSEDLIKRSDAIEAVMNTEPVFAVDSLEPYQKTKDVVEALEAVPSADRPQGEWVKRTRDMLIAQVNFAYCSECGQPIMHEHTRPLWSFCPNCGARMKGADDERHDI